jgi:hypothetical protein
MRAEQTVNEMAQEVLWRQAKDHAKRTGEPLAEALEAVLQTPAGRLTGRTRTVSKSVWAKSTTTNT